MYAGRATRDLPLQKWWTKFYDTGSHGYARPRGKWCKNKEPNTWFHAFYAVWTTPVLRWRTTWSPRLEARLENALRCRVDIPTGCCASRRSQWVPYTHARHQCSAQALEPLHSVSVTVPFGLPCFCCSSVYKLTTTLCLTHILWPWSQG